MRIEIGSIWQENDPRFIRYIEVIEQVNDLYVIIKNLKTGRKTTAQSCRFDGKLHNYKRVSKKIEAGLREKGSKDEKK